MFKKVTSIISTGLAILAGYRFFKENWPVIREALDKLKNRR